MLKVPLSRVENSEKPPRQTERRLFLMIEKIEKVVYTFSPHHAAASTINSGDMIMLQTKDCFSNQIQAETQLMDGLDLDHINPATGPIYVDGAEPGDALMVDILDIQTADHGVITSMPDTGPLHHLVEKRTKIIPIQKGVADFNGIKIPIDTMIGVIGCTPLEEIPCGWVADHGGNLDCKLIKKGSRLYCPVYLPGALFQLGDLHALMGDAELCGTGIEIPGLVTVRLTVIKQAHLKLPVLETTDKWYTLGNAKEFPEALQKTTQAMQDLLIKAYGWDATEAYMYLSIQGDVEICQSCIPCTINMVLRCGVPKRPGIPLVSSGKA